MKRIFLIATLLIGGASFSQAQDLCSELNQIQQNATSGFDGEKGNYDAKYRDGAWDAKTKIKGSSKCYIEETNLQYVAVVYSGSNFGGAEKIYKEWVNKVTGCKSSSKTWYFNNIVESQRTTYFSDGSEKLGNEPVTTLNGEGDRIPTGNTVIVDLLPTNKDLNSGTGTRTWEVRIRVYKAQ